MQSSNPALAKLTPANATNTYGQPGWYQPGAATPGGATTAFPDVITRSGTMTVDDVIVRTLGLLILLAVSAAAAWVWVPEQLRGLVLLAGAIGGLVLGLVISFGRMTNPVAVMAYSVIQGVVVGLISELYNSWYEGIVTQAVLATFAIFFIMLILYRFRVIRATPRFTKGLIGALVAGVALMLADFVLSLFHIQTGLRENGLLGIVFSVAMIVIGALTFILDFDLVERGTAAGMPRRYAWFAAFGIVVGLIWVYLEVLRLLSYLRGSD
jgi:uncharacterized YccA/Bax inhibitor family protein